MRAKTEFVFLGGFLRGAARVTTGRFILDLVSGKEFLLGRAVHKALPTQPARKSPI
jgi:hypothetical protein